MAFKIRNFNEEYEPKEKLYREHLEKISKNENSDLWKFFYWDTFHDGHIEEITFGDGLKDVILHISCPNIKKRKEDSGEYLQPIGFECHFRNVAYFSHEYEDSEELYFESNSDIEYLYSEIDTLTELINKHNVKGEDKEGEGDIVFHSLILYLLGRQTNSYMEVVFSQVDVYPKEPIAFELMLASDDFYVPIYRKYEDFESLPEWINSC